VRELGCVCVLTPESVYQGLISWLGGVFLFLPLNNDQVCGVLASICLVCLFACLRRICAFVVVEWRIRFSSACRAMNSRLHV